MPLRTRFLKGRFDKVNLQAVSRTGSQTVNNTTYTLTVRPGAGRTWKVILGFGVIKTIVGQNASTNSRIEFFLNAANGDATLISGITYNASDTFNQHAYTAKIEDIQLTNTNYLTLVFTNTSPHNNVFEGGVITEEL